MHNLPVWLAAVLAVGVLLYVLVLVWVVVVLKGRDLDVRVVRWLLLLVAALLLGGGLFSTVVAAF